jgi:cytochrome c oxidase subunit 4
MSSHDHNPSAAAASAELFDELDPHGFDKGHTHGHGHVIVGPFTLRSILALLLLFTVLTVFLAQAEVWAQNYFHIVLPWWVNVFGAMTIAVIKALLVMAFFMQLKYDNPINTVLMCFTFAALAIFLGFTGMDLFNRAAVDPVRNTMPMPGGTFATGNKPMTVGAADAMLETLKKRHNGDEAAAKADFERMHHIILAAHGHAEHGEPQGSTASMSRPRTGLSDALSLTEPAKDEHGGSHEPDKHGEPAKEGEPGKHAAR